MCAACVHMSAHVCMCVYVCVCVHMCRHVCMHAAFVSDLHLTEIKGVFNQKQLTLRNDAFSHSQNSVVV